MTRLTVGFERFDVVVVPFPFTDRNADKRRPALVLSSAKFNAAAGHSVMAMITSLGNAPWPLDAPISDLAAAGLPAVSVVRMKLFILDHRLVLRKAGQLAAKDRRGVEKALRELLEANV
jgi:mRNA interferase MazF